MFRLLLMNMDIVHKIFLNTILISIPEAIYLVMITLILIGEFDYWKEEECKKIINKWDYSRILIPSVIVGFVINVIKYTNNDSLPSTCTCFLIFYVLIAITNDILKDSRPLKWLAKAFVFLIIGEITIGLTEYLYIPFVVYATGKNVAEFSNNILLNFLLLLPSRIIQFTIVAVLVNIRRKRGKESFFTYLASNKILLLILSVLVVFNFFFLCVIYKGIVFRDVLSNLSSVMQFEIIICAILFPLLNISASLWAVFYVKNQEMNEKRDTLNKLEIILDYTTTYKNEKKYDDITWKLHEISSAIEELSVSLNKGAKPDHKEDKEL